MALRQPKGRKCLPGGLGRKVRTNTVASFSAAHKLDVLRHLEAHNGAIKTMLHYYPDLPAAKVNSRRTLIPAWRRSQTKLEALCTQRGDANKKKARQKGEATILPMEREADLVRWVNGMRNEGVPVTPTMLHIQALDVAEDAGIKPTRQGQIRPPELDHIALKFAEVVKAKAEEIGASRIYNADQTAS
ncbi:hypothetical protein ON010_g4015 [Phytophthora cinnamomi]|nr:hypothetical protein ON010_g4015 [Phytophthora cinnamomi]